MSPFLLLLLSLLTLTIPSLSTTTIGITYRPSSTLHLPSPTTVAAFLRRNSIPAVRILTPSPSSDTSVVRAFSYSNISLFLSIPNAYVPSLSSNRSIALHWLYHHVVPFYPRANIAAISVGIDPLNAKIDLTDHIVPAVRNVHIALHELGIKGIEVSTTFTVVSILTKAFPPSAAEFSEPVGGLIMRPLLQFLQETNSSFFVILQPYYVFRSNPEIPIGFAVFQESPFGFRDDFVTGVRYRNLFDVMVDAVVTAMTKEGREGIPIVVAETGWPSGSGGGGKEMDANGVYAEMYLKGLVRHLRSGVGTPLRKEGVKEVYLYELFDRQVGMDGQQWGLLYPNLTEKYDVVFGSSGIGRFGVDLFCLVFVVAFVGVVLM